MKNPAQNSVEINNHDDPALILEEVLKTEEEISLRGKALLEKLMAKQ